MEGSKMTTDCKCGELITDQAGRRSYISECGPCYSRRLQKAAEAKASLEAQKD